MKQPPILSKIQGLFRHADRVSAQELETLIQDLDRYLKHLHQKLSTSSAAMRLEALEEFQAVRKAIQKEVLAVCQARKLMPHDLLPGGKASVTPEAFVFSCRLRQQWGATFSLEKKRGNRRGARLRMRI